VTYYRRRARRRPVLDLAPMVDVVFLLVIFFMTSTSFVRPATGLPVDLPSAQRPPTTATARTVELAADGTIAYDGRSGLTPSQLQAALSAGLRGDAKAVTLRADRRALHGRVVQVMDAIKRAGATRLTVAAQDQ